MTELVLEGLSRAFGPVRALDGVDLILRHGEVHALMGENGAGKSTLIRQLAGLDRPEAGRMVLDGTPLPLGSPTVMRDAGLRFIHQELHPVRGLSVAENMHLDRRYPQRLGLVDWRRLNRAASTALDRIGLSRIAPRARMSDLGVGDQMLVRLAGTLIEDEGSALPWLYVMDEPTAALTGEESERLFLVIDGLTARGAGVLYVSHRMPEVLRLAHRVSVLRDGRHVSTRQIGETSQDRIIREMTGRDLSALYPPRLTGRPGTPVLEIERLSAPGLTEVSLSLRAGEIMGVAGLAGAGRGALLRAIMGAVPRLGGVVRLNGETMPARPAAAWARGLAYVPRERRSEGLLLRKSITDNVMLPHLANFARVGIFVDPRRQTRTVKTLGQEVGLRATGPDQPCEALSGGNQQKVVFARALAGKPRVLIMDEPTRGVDVAAKADIYQLLRRLSAEGVAILMASSDLPELLGLADRIIVLQEGRRTHLLENHDMTEADLLAHLYDVPTSAKTVG